MWTYATVILIMGATTGNYNLYFIKSFIMEFFCYESISLLKNNFMANTFLSSKYNKNVLTNSVFLYNQSINKN